MSRKLIFVFAALGISGCATPLIDKQKAASLTHLSPKEFIKQRFYEEEKSPVLDAVGGFISAIGKYTRTTDQRPPRPEIVDGLVSPDGSVIVWTAYYTNQNFVQLARPAVELRLFCLAQNGEVTILENRMEDILAHLRRAPLEAYYSAYYQVHRLMAARGQYVGIEELRDAIANTVASEVAEDAIKRNAAVDANYAAQALTYAQRLNSFGKFECTLPTPATSWFYSVLPLAFTPKDPNNSLIAASAHIAIKVYGPGSDVSHQASNPSVRK